MRLRELGGYLIVRHGRAAQVIPELAVERGRAVPDSLRRFRALPATP
jgi:hypothetical protein